MNKKSDGYKLSKGDLITADQVLDGTSPTRQQFQRDAQQAIELGLVEYDQWDRAYYPTQAYIDLVDKFSKK